MIKRSIFHLAWTLSLLLTVSSAQAEAVQEIVLDNGLKVLLLEDHKSPSVTFQVWYRVGSRNEKDGKSGLSPFRCASPRWEEHTSGIHSPRHHVCRPLFSKKKNH